MVAIITALWPTEAGTWTPIIVNQVIPVLSLLVAIFFPAGKAVAAVYRARASTAYWQAIKAGKAPKPAGAAPEITPLDKLNELLRSIYAGLETDGTPYKDDAGNIDPVPVAPNLTRELANRWNDETQGMGFRQVLLQAAITTASEAFTAATTLPAPTKWTEVAAPQTYWLNHKVNCMIHSAGLFHQVLTPLRTALKIRDTGEV
jgi:hypothetical protein